MEINKERDVKKGLNSLSRSSSTAEQMGKFHGSLLSLGK